MRAQQVVDLNACKKAISELEDAVNNIQSVIATNNAENASRFQVVTEAINGIRTAITELNLKWSQIITSNPSFELYMV